MNNDIQDLLENDSAAFWVGLDVVLEAWNVGKKRAYQLIKTEHVRTTPGRPHQYAFADVRRVWRNRQEQDR